MRHSEIVVKAMSFAAAVAVVVGAFNLVPHIRAERVTPVVIQPPQPDSSVVVVVLVTGETARPGVYTFDGSVTLSEIIDLVTAGPGEDGLSIAIIIDPPDDSKGEQQVDLNRAPPWLLEALPGIGPERASAIVDYRERHGSFSCTDELTLVPGIGLTTYESLKDMVTVTP